MRIGYFVNDDIHSQKDVVFEQFVRARALVNGEVAATVERKLGELQNF